MNIQGTISEIFDTIHVSETFKKRGFVIEIKENNYSEVISFEFIQDKCDILDQYSLGQVVEVDFNLKGRKWVNPQGEAKYFNTLQAWRIKDVSNGQEDHYNGGQANPTCEPNNNDQLANQPEQSSTPPPMPDMDGEPSDDIPF